MANDEWRMTDGGPGSRRRSLEWSPGAGPGPAVSPSAIRQWRIQETFPVRADFATIGGLEAGQRVRVQGIDAGVVEAIVPPDRPGGAVRLGLRLDARLGPL